MSRVLRLSHAIWSEGMSLKDYTDYNLAQKSSPWGRERYRFLIGVDRSGTILSSLKLFTILGCLDDRDLRIAGVGAVFTPPEARGRGHAAELVRRSLEQARAAGHDLALLMSEIDETYYRRLGFQTLPASEAACRTILPVPWPHEPAWVLDAEPLRSVPGLRLFRPDDLGPLVEIRRANDEGRRFRIVRDRLAWEHLLQKLETGHRLRRDGADLIWVIERHGRVDAYAILKESPGALLWREHGARNGAADLLGDLFWSALAWARGRGLGRLEGWFLPPGITDSKLYPVARRARRKPAIMIRALDAALPPVDFVGEGEFRVGQLDCF